MDGAKTFRYKQSSLSSGGGLLKTAIVKFRVASGTAVVSLLLREERSHLQLNCWMQEGLTFVVTFRPNGLTCRGGVNRRGGEDAKGTPKNLFTGAVALGRAVVVPTTIPPSTMAVGAQLAAYEAESNKTATCINDFILE